ncbi:MAG TPA: UDP-N-acetylmuramate--L-alanine ligase [Thermomicrobiales bacterium]|nr:UDP-N-acetylmuramate--L-alanine ligase [Thermomicrobiales bacterium]
MTDQAVQPAAQETDTLPPSPATFHFIGIGGIGMSGLARILHAWGYRVSGSDAADSAQVAALRALGIEVVIGHDDPTLAGLADVVVTTLRAVVNAPLEVDAAISAGARLVKRGQLLGMIGNARRLAAVAGTHGKSTTSGMLTVALRALGADPTYAVGAIIGATGTNADPGDGPHMVVEADEFDRAFHFLRPEIGLITSVAYDHPDIYPDQQSYDEAFVEYARNITPGGTLIVAGDDPGCRRVIGAVRALDRPDLTITTFGETDDVDWRLARTAPGWSVTGPDGQTHPISLAVPGRHNARNATAAIAVLAAFGFTAEQAIAGVAAYTGIGRRFEHKGTVRGAAVVDDYAHHPDELNAVLSAAREHFPGRRIIAVHQPHTYTRTEALMPEFAASLEQADVVVLLDIYSSGEENTHQISSADLGRLIQRPVHLAAGPEDAVATVLEVLEENDVVLTLGAGDITRVGPLLMQTGPLPETPAARPRRAPGTTATATIPNAPGLKVLRDAAMSLYTTMRIGGTADFLVRAPSPEEILAATRWAADEGLPVSVIGGGSNLLVGDDGIRGLVIVARTPGERAEALVETVDLGTHVEITVGAQAPLSWVGRYCAEQGWSGMDWAVGLPGQIGGATVNNAGAHGTETKDHLIGVELLLADGEIRREDAAWMRAEYRITRVKGAPRPRPWTLLRSTFRLPKGDRESLMRLADEHAAFRRRTQPTGACSGSTFANPPGDFAGRLIEAAGLKGHTHGAMQLSPKHANWVMNTGGGTAVEAWELILHTQEVVSERFGVELRPEIERIGDHRI